MNNTFMGLLLIVIGFVLFLIGVRKRGAQFIAELAPSAKSAQPVKRTTPAKGAK